MFTNDLRPRAEIKKCRALFDRTFVEDGVTGFVTAPDPAQIAGALARVAADPDLCTRLGAAGQTRVAGITWDGVVDTLLAGAR